MRPEVFADTLLVPPSATAAVRAPSLLALTMLVDRQMRHQRALPHEIAPVVSTLVIAVTAAAVLALASWHQPAGRLIHVLRPRETSERRVTG